LVSAISSAPAEIAGITKVVAGAAFSAGAELMADTNGRAILWVAGAGSRKVGMALEASAAANAMVAMLIYTPNVSVLT
jgi:hypothetical protein